MSHRKVHKGRRTRDGQMKSFTEILRYSEYVSYKRGVKIQSTLMKVAFRRNPCTKFYTYIEQM
jgi:hypothetical protein